MAHITNVLNQFLKPLGFKRQASSWLKYERPLLVRVSYYSSRWGGPGFIDLALTISDTEITNQSIGEWDASRRIHDLIPSGSQIRDIIRKDLTDTNAKLLEQVLHNEATDLLQRIQNPTEAVKIVKHSEVTSYGTVKGWLTRNDFLKRLEDLI